MLDRIFLVLSIVLGALGQVCFKMGIDKIQGKGLQFYIQTAMSPWVIAGFAGYGLSFVLWMKVLQHYDVSYARPVTSIGYIITYVFAVFLLGEDITARRVAGIALITAGVFLLK